MPTLSNPPATTTTPAAYRNRRGVAIAPFTRPPRCTWNSPGGALELRDTEIHLWRADLTRNMDALPALEQTLSPDELVRAGRFRSELDRARYILGHGALRAILSRYLDTMPHELAFRCGACGKPELTTGALRFNMSHSSDLLVWAISSVADVGVDVEQVRPGVVAEATGCFSPRIRRILQTMPPPDRSRTFFRAWTRIEAYSKARGEGLTLDLAGLEFLVELNDSASPPQPDDAGADSHWWLHVFCPRGGYAAALAARGSTCRLRCWKWHADEPATLR